MMRRLLIILAFLLCTVCARGQVKQHARSEVYVDWQLSNQGGYGLPSFYWKVDRIEAVNGGYRYDLYFYSNSFYTNGAWTSTYVWDIYLNVDGYYLRREPVWIMFKEAYNNQLLSFYTTSTSPKIILTWGGLRVY